MGHHIPRDKKHKKTYEHDEGARKRRTSFKQYLRNLEEEELIEEYENDLDEDEDEPFV